MCGEGVARVRVNNDSILSFQKRLYECVEVRPQNGVQNVWALHEFVGEIFAHMRELHGESLRNIQTIHRGLFRICKKLWGHEEGEWADHFKISERII